MKATVTGRYQMDKSNATASFNLASAGDISLKASMADATLIAGPSLNDLVLSLEKPAAFTIDYNVNKKAFNFQFMNSLKLMEKNVNLVYMHNRGINMTMLNASMVLDPANQVCVNYMLGSNSCAVNHVYTHGELQTTNTYNMPDNTWDCAVTRKLEGGHSVTASYKTSSRMLGLEWNNNAFFNGCFRLSASMNLADQQKIPCLVAEHTWNYEI